MNQASEWQFDGLVGPTHNYAGLAFGNLAAAKNAGAVSNPKAAALQGLEKMRFVRDLGVKQAFLPPHPRPIITELKRNGFVGDNQAILNAAAAQAPVLLSSVFSSAFMWTANAATVTPKRDSSDGKLHFTPANLVSHYHRGMESSFSHWLLSRIFHNRELFSVHNYLNHSPQLGDEGAANHMRVAQNHSEFGLNIFVYGESYDENRNPHRFPARQQRAASESVARLHGLNQENCIYLQQTPGVIDQGVFHNDVIAMNTTTLMIAHESAFVPSHRELLKARLKGENACVLREVTTEDLSVQDAVGTYLFNSQLIDVGGGSMVLVAPSECGNHAGTRQLVDRFLQEGLLTQVHYRDVRESMRNGGGPACLRLRVVMTPEEEQAIHPGIILTDAAYEALKKWVSTHYRDRVQFEDFRDPTFVEELKMAYLALEQLLGMKGLYSDWVFPG